MSLRNLHQLCPPVPATSTRSLFHTHLTPRRQTGRPVHAREGREAVATRYCTGPFQMLATSVASQENNHIGARAATEAARTVNPAPRWRSPKQPQTHTGTQSSARWTQFATVFLPDLPDLNVGLVVHELGDRGGRYVHIQPLADRRRQVRARISCHDLEEDAHRSLSHCVLR